MAEPVDTHRVGYFEVSKKGDAVVVALREWRGRRFVDVRRFYKDEKGELAPTQKGVALQLKDLDQILTLLQKARQEAIERQWMR